MKFFIDTADVDAIREANTMGLVDGVTTNPSLIKKAGRDHEQTIKEIDSFIDGPISVETLSEDTEGMLKEAEEYIKWGKNIVIKVVMTAEGMKAVRELTKRGIQTNVTLIFTPMQAMIAAKAGATYVSPFVGRLDDIEVDGMAMIEECRVIFDNYGFPTEILVASVRHVEHVLMSSIIGADVATIPPKILTELLQHDLTDKGIAQFLADAKEWKTAAV